MYNVIKKGGENAQSNDLHNCYGYGCDNTN